MVSDRTLNINTARTRLWPQSYCCQNSRKQTKIIANKSLQRAQTSAKAAVTITPALT